MRQERFSTRPLYLQVRDDLAQRIATGEWKPGNTLPNEIELAREVGVSSGTMRKSLDLLEGEHLVTRRQGRGTFVNDPSSQHLAHRYDNIHLADDTRVVGEVRTLDMVSAEASGIECTRLKLVRGDHVYRITRIRSYSNKPFMFEEASLPVSLFPCLVETAVASHRLVDIARAYQLLLGGAEERISVEPPSRVAAEALNLASGTHVLALDRVIKTRDGRPAEWRRAECVLNGAHYLALYS
jgi:GntR family transcriptional regulator